MATKTLHVSVRALISADALHEDDASLPGTYAVFVPAELSKEVMVEAALDAFHDHQGIEVLDDFEILVIDPDTLLVLEPGDDECAADVDAEYAGKVSEQPFDAQALTAAPITADELISQLGAMLVNLMARARCFLRDDQGDTSDASQLVAILNRAGELEAAINGISADDLKAQPAESSTITRALLLAESAYIECGSIDGGKIGKDLPVGIRGTLLADLIASEIRETLEGEATMEPAADALEDTAACLLEVAQALR